MRKNNSTCLTGGVKYVSLYEASGYGHAARGYLQAIRSSDVPLSWTPMVKGGALGSGYEPFRGSEVGDSDLDPLCNKEIDYDTVIVHTVPEYFPYWVHQEPNKLIIGYTVWETDRIPRHWPALLNKVDHLLVPCRWNRQVFRQCGVTTPIDIIPHIFEETDLGSGTPLDIEPSDFVFYTIGVWNARKALWNTIRCYLDNFTARDHTLLVIKTTREDFTRKLFFGKFGTTKDAVSRILRNYGSPARIKLIDDEISDESILKLHRRGDCYVSLCRSEGWGLGAFDAAGFGKPVLMTAFGGQLDFLPAHLAFLVDYTMIPVVVRTARRSYSDDQNWAEPDMKHASLLMRQVFDNREEARTRGTMLRKHVRENFNRNIILEKLLRAVTG